MDSASDEALADRQRAARPARTASGPPPPQAPEIARGVESLIAELRARGVEAGEREAARLVADARAEAEAILAAARAEAASIVAAAQEARSREEAAARAALSTAVRDAIIALRADLLEKFSDNVRRMVSRALAEPELLARMILAVTERAAATAAVGPGTPADILLPERLQTLDELRADLEALRQSPLTRFVLAGVEQSLEGGVTLRAAPGLTAGLRVRLADGTVEIDLSDAAIADVLLAHLRPRFRALFEGIIA